MEVVIISFLEPSWLLLTCGTADKSQADGLHIKHMKCGPVLEGSKLIQKGHFSVILSFQSHVEVADTAKTIGQ